MLPRFGRAVPTLSPGRRGCAVERPHNSIAVAESPTRLSSFDPSSEPAARLVGQILEEQRIHCPLEADVEVCDLAFRKRDNAHAEEGEPLEETGRVFLIATETVE
jgi:hypothetical protein